MGGGGHRVRLCLPVLPRTIHKDDGFLMARQTERSHSSKRENLIWIGLTAAFVALVFWQPGVAKARSKEKAPEKIEEINKEFHFLGPEDTVLIHEEDGKLKGQINVFAGPEESDDILSYLLTIGTRVKDHVEFKTSKVHEKYFRFSGSVERGEGKKEEAPDYLRLVGTLEIVTVNGMTGKETTETRHVVLKSLGAEEIED
jgi:hypothetical protein